MQTRRSFVKKTALASTLLGTIPLQSFSMPNPLGKRKFSMALNGGSIGVKAGLSELIELATKFGYESVSPDARYLEQLDDASFDALLEKLDTKKLQWAAAGLTFDFRQDAQKYREGLRSLPKYTKALQRAGVTRMGTWILPFHEELTYLENFSLHTQRLKEIGKVLGDHGIRFGLEYVGPKTSWTSKRYAFLHTLYELRELLDAIDEPLMGVVLDSYHWFTSEETEEHLLSLTNDDVVSCDLNDAPANVPIHQQKDLVRELPMVTGVIPIKTFLEALIKIGYDGPIRAEPFSKSLSEEEDEKAVEIASLAMKKAFQLID